MDTRLRGYDELGSTVGCKLGAVLRKFYLKKLPCLSQVPDDRQAEKRESGKAGKTLGMTCLVVSLPD
ncbi:hypothetical protein UNDYM_4886 [Undibacterium sp. YM2]|uniref:hypothetical protein n=1 Tax=Undibacterium sp. YM2 TaxID=2058625 RepID=UPI001331EA6A|nr:hypothetical protein [Undibacterium sp. YM2]BBB69139.1 hypothetical protein UNDYM_4886 [Undibacterium sp. YM2]